MVPLLICASWLLVLSLVLGLCVCVAAPAGSTRCSPVVRTLPRAAARTRRRIDRRPSRRFSTSHLATFDERHFRSVRPLDDHAGAFTLPPTDTT